MNGRLIESSCVCNLVALTLSGTLVVKLFLVQDRFVQELKKRMTEETHERCFPDVCTAKHVSEPSKALRPWNACMERSNRLGDESPKANGVWPPGQRPPCTCLGCLGVLQIGTPTRDREGSSNSTGHTLALQYIKNLTNTERHIPQIYWRLALEMASQMQDILGSVLTGLQ
eukprot:6469496-Amphidinium_carterae.1